MAAFQDVDPVSAPGHRNPLLNKCVLYSIQINGEICRAKTTIMALSRKKILDMNTYLKLLLSKVLLLFQKKYIFIFTLYFFGIINVSQDDGINVAAMAQKLLTQTLPFIPEIEVLPKSKFIILLP